MVQASLSEQAVVIGERPANHESSRHADALYDLKYSWKTHKHIYLIRHFPSLKLLFKKKKKKSKTKQNQKQAARQSLEWFKQPIYTCYYCSCKEEQLLK